MPTISIAIQKGGSGKTTTAISIAAAWQQMGHRVLLVDVDPQANCTQAFGFSDEEERNVYELLKVEATGKPVNTEGYLKTIKPKMDLMPSALSLANAEIELVGVYGRERLLQGILDPLSKIYDFIIIDCPPSMGILTVNALTASDYILMPLQAEFLPLKGVQSFYGHLEKVIQKVNPKLQVIGFVLTQYDNRKNISRHILDELNRLYPNKVLSTSIRRSVSLVEAQQQGIDIFAYDKTAHGAMDYMALSAEVLERIKNSRQL
jgi:chromosome partitioning protein